MNGVGMHMAADQYLMSAKVIFQRTFGFHHTFSFLRKFSSLFLISQYVN